MAVTSIVVDYPFTYEAEVMLPKKRLPRQITVHDRVPLGITALDGDDFPIAFQCSAFNSPHAKSDYRFYGGSLYRASTPSRELSALVEKIEAGNAGFTPQLLPDWMPGDLSEQPMQRGQDVKASDLNGEVLKDNRRETVAMLIDRLADDCIFANGQVWRKTGEPFWLLTSSIWPVTKRLQIVPTSQWHTVENQGYENTFALCDLPNAMNYAREFIGGGEDVTVHDVLEVLMPEVINTRFADRKLVDAAKRFLRDIEDHLKNANMAFFQQYIALREATEGITSLESFSATAAEVTPKFMEAVTEIVSTDDLPNSLNYDRRRGELLFDFTLAVEAYRGSRYAQDFPELRQEPASPRFP
ncbi:hypothetical protein ACFOY8_14920 [Thalassospira xianhensis]|uniref:Uncharacterized protein n=1 Tax=Thalassospira xianhensis MCCC 1A02616 TaxID=1177929 RepID=A0A367UKC0_9PROT|nr:hypothetical protein [Thalassospira xianhensis]RCK07562.1 hypothetical protein TH5_00305 [Thalassospira xianhensis MCCC 1A02616]